MKSLNWEAIEDSTYVPLPAGGYVIRIIGVEDVPEREYLWVYFDVAEGPFAGYFSDDYGREHPKSHRFVCSYKQAAQGMFKGFLTRLEETNPGFSVAAWQRTSDERAFVGLFLGVAIQYEDFTDEQGEDRQRRNVVGTYSADQIRKGDFRLPQRKDSRKSVGTADTGASVYSGAAYSAPSAVPAYGAASAGAAYGTAPAPYTDDLPF